ncbi:hypothetical protein DB771_23585 [Burkholderia sp. AU29985]|nr:hypothetical protein EGY28_18940 [Burkholderia dolosa]PRE48242.1 hypothetical protein C6P87_16435 [Burkholderia sp. AU12872]PUA74450.1 hypothetical protein DB771_23585 [Burkholderia sp. AU29985]
MTGRLNGVGDARSRRCAADDLFSRICSEPPGRRQIDALAGSRARNRVSKSARFRHAAHGRQSAEYSGKSARCRERSRPWIRASGCAAARMGRCRAVRVVRRWAGR